jgi:hypothetical protein
MCSWGGWNFYSQASQSELPWKNTFVILSLPATYCVESQETLSNWLVHISSTKSHGKKKINTQCLPPRGRQGEMPGMGIV